MLMLAVTVMIAAVVSTYAGGFADTNEKVPQSSFKVRANLLENTTYFDHAGGDPLSLENLQVVFVSGENKTAIRTADIGTRCINFSQVGGGSTIRAGDTFFIRGETPGNQNGNTGHTGIRFGNFVMMKDREVTWMVIDTRSSKTISMGSFFL